MTVDKTVLKKMIESTKPNDLMVATISSLDKDSQKKVRSDLDKFISKSGEYAVLVVRR